MQLVPKNHQAELPHTAVDLWEIDAQAPMEITSQEGIPVGPDGSENTSRPTALLSMVLIGTILAGGGYIAWDAYKNGEIDPYLIMMKDFLGLTESTPSFDPSIARNPPKSRAGDGEKVIIADVVEGNPYWHLPNRIAEAVPMNRRWTAEEQQRWRSGIAHRFVYQHFKTVQEVREQRLKGSEAIFWEAMQDRKFWTRMWSLIGIAEFNREVSLSDVEQALGDSRSELVKDFFERFIKRSTHGQRYVMRHAVKLLDEQGRLMVLKVLARQRDVFTPFYLAAASLDPGSRVQRWAAEHGSHGYDAQTWEEALAVVRGVAKFDPPPEVAAKMVRSSAAAGTDSQDSKAPEQAPEEKETSEQSGQGQNDDEIGQDQSDSEIEQDQSDDEIEIYDDDFAEEGEYDEDEFDDEYAADDYGDDN